MERIMSRGMAMNHAFSGALRIPRMSIQCDKIPNPSPRPKDNLNGMFKGVFLKVMVRIIYPTLIGRIKLAINFMVVSGIMVFL